MVNVTMKEYSESVVTDGITVIKVREHKTGKFGNAKLTLDPNLPTIFTVMSTY